MADERNAGCVIKWSNAMQREAISVMRECRRGIREYAFKLRE